MFKTTNNPESNLSYSSWSTVNWLRSATTQAMTTITSAISKPFDAAVAKAASWTLQTSKEMPWLFPTNYREDKELQTNLYGDEIDILKTELTEIISSQEKNSVIWLYEKLDGLLGRISKLTLTPRLYEEGLDDLTKYFAEFINRGQLSEEYGKLLIALQAYSA
jgi:hypothetical protein